MPLDMIMPLIYTLLGGILTLTGQLFIKYIDRIYESRNSKMEIKSIVSMQLCLLSFQIKDLAYFKQNTELQLLYSILESNQEKKHKYLDEHNKSNLNIWDCDKLISGSISSIVGSLVKYQLMSRKTHEIDNLLIQIRELKFETAKDYSELTSIPGNDIVSRDILELYSSYSDKFNLIKSMVNNVINE